MALIDINNWLNKGKKLKELNLDKPNKSNTTTTKKEDQSNDKSNDETGPKEE